MKKRFGLPALALVGGLLIVAALLAVGFGATTAIAGNIFKSSDAGAHAQFSSFEETDALGCGIITDVWVNANEFDFQSPPGPGPGGGPPWVSVNINRFDTCDGEWVSFGWAGGEASSFSIDEKRLSSAMAEATVDGWECPAFDGDCEPLHASVYLEWTGEDGISTYRSTSHVTYPDGSKQNCRYVNKDRGAMVAGVVNIDGNAFHGGMSWPGVLQAEFAGLHTNSQRCTFID